MVLKKLFRGRFKREQHKQPDTTPEPQTETVKSQVQQRVAALGLTPEEIAEDISNARYVSRNGAPFGAALWFELAKRNVNPQFIDEYMDAYPDWAYGEHLPGEHMVFMLRSWARENGQSEAEQYKVFKHYGLLAGWRPGDINAIWLDTLVGGTSELPPPGHDPLGRQHLPDNLVVAPNALDAYAILSARAEDIMKAKNDG